MSGIIPERRPPSIAIGNCEVFPSAITLETAGVLSSTSRAGRRPPPILRNNTCTMTPRSEPASASCACRRYSGAYESMMRSIAPVAVCAEKPPITRRPAAAASRATFMSAPVRRSSITRTSGSSRSAARAAASISSSSPRISRWLMNESPRPCTMLTSRSIVITWSRRVRFIRSTNAEMSVRFPLERGPATRTIPSGSSASAWT